MEDYPKEAIVIANKVKEIMKKELSVFKDKPCIQETFKQIAATIQRIFQPELAHLDYDLIHNGSRVVTITAKNLYTLLLFQGVQAPYELIKDLTEYPTEFGTYAMKDGNPVFMSTKTIDYIDFSVCFDENMNIIKGI